MNRTPWFPASQKPVRKGVYQRRLNGDIYYSMWDGRRWLMLEMSADDAKYSVAGSGYQELDWRGLVKP